MTGLPSGNDDLGVFATDDARMRDGVLDPTDRLVLREAGIVSDRDRRERIVSSAELVARLSALHDDEPIGMHAAVPDAGGRPAMQPMDDPSTLKGTFLRADAVFAAFEQIAGVVVDSLPRAHAVRRWRVEQRLTWRGVARKAWPRERAWSPPENQLMGLALCARAAQLLGERHDAGAWN